MSNKIPNYSEENKSKRRLLPFFVLISIAAILAVGVAGAYFSDIFRLPGSASTATLRLNGNYTFTLNGTASTIDSLTGLNPGDVIVINGTVNNTGTQAAWIRERIVIDTANQALLSNLFVYNTALTQAELLGGTDYSAYAIALTNGAASAATKVIDGSSATPSGGGFVYVGRTTYEFALTIYFAHTAPNETQNQTFGLEVMTQALQFANNNAGLPDENAWATVSAAV